MTKREEIIKTLSEVDVSKYIENKMGLSYLSWANAWAILTQYYPESTYEFTEYPEYMIDPETKTWKSTGRLVDYRLTAAGCEVTATVNICGEKFNMSLYVMDNRNKVVPNPNYAQINKTQQRCLVKALALAGLGLNVYQGEDLPTGENMKRKGIDADRQRQIQAQQKELGEAKTEMTKLMAEVSTLRKVKTADLQNEVVERIQQEYQGAGDLTPLEKYKAMVSVLLEMKKSATGKNSEEMTFEEVK